MLETLLSPSEYRIAQLVAVGLNNRAIAAELRIGRRTVEDHLSNIYHKLGLNRPHSLDASNIPPSNYEQRVMLARRVWNEQEEAAGEGSAQPSSR